MSDSECLWVRLVGVYSFAAMNNKPTLVETIKIRLCQEHSKHSEGKKKQSLDFFACNYLRFFYMIKLP